MMNLAMLGIIFVLGGISLQLFLCGHQVYSILLFIIPIAFVLVMENSEV